MPQKKKQPKNKNWAQLSQHFVKQWPEVLEGIELSKMPVDYVDTVAIQLKNNITISIDVLKTLKTASKKTTADMLKKYIKKHYAVIKHADLKFNMTKLKKDIKGKTAKMLEKAFKQ